MKTSWIAICIGILVFLPGYALAQLDNYGPTFELVSLPQFPEPQQTFTVSLNAYSIDTTGASIRWYVDGVEQTANFNQNEITLTAGSLGDKTVVQVQLTLRNGFVLTKSTEITVSQIDLVIEADTMTPAFYRGRALPSLGSSVRLIAFPTITDGGTDPKSYSYKWSLNNQVLFGGARNGLYVANIDLPTFGDEQLVSVDVFASDGTLVAQKILAIPIVSPEVHFYEENALRGTSDTAFRDTSVFISDELEVRVEPYYLDRAIYSQKYLSEWRINNQRVENPSEDPQRITLRKSSGTGSFVIEYQIRNLVDILQGTKGKFVLTF